MATRISKESLRKYFISVLDKEQVKKYVEGASLLKQNKFKPKMLRDYTPKMMYQRIPGGGILKKAAGVCKGCNDIRIADWILVDSTEAKATVRHEIAHALQHYKYGTNVRSHGKEFIEALKIVSPNGWRKDRHYQETPEIVKARTASFSNKKISLR
jgi:hypothetical protein